MAGKRLLLTIGLILLLVILGSSAYWLIEGRTPSDSKTQSTSHSTTIEYTVREIPLGGPAARRDAELSGLAWYGDTLILLPQYPGRLSQREDGALFALPKERITAYLKGETHQPLEPREIPLSSGGFEDSIVGFQGYEAIAFLEDRVYLAIEAGIGTNMMGYLIAGQMKPDLSGLSLDPESLTENPPQLNRVNKSDESLLVMDGDIISFYEVNGQEINPNPSGSQFNSSLSPQGKLSFPHIEYRVTDASRPDDQKRFWVINCFFPGDVDLHVNDEPLTSRFGVGPSHASSHTVERLVEFTYTPDGFILTDTPPIQLELLEFGDSRNWEGLARLDDRGFLLVTDKYPDTILGFVEYP